MDILLKQTFEINNLVTKSGKFTQNEFQKLIQYIVIKYKDYTTNISEYMVSTTRSIEVVDGEQILDVEILLPVSYRIPVEETYVFKNMIRITNALYAKVEDANMLQEALNEVNKYIISNGLQPITSAYLVQTKKDNKLFVEIYIGLNPNIL